MSKTESWKAWVAIIFLLVVFALLAAVVPGLVSNLGAPIGFGGGEGVRAAEINDIVIPPITNPISGEVIEIDPINPAMALMGITVFTVGLVVSVGAVLGFVYVLLSKFVANTKESESFQENEQALANKEKEQLKARQSDRKAATARENPTMPRWSMISTSLIILLFVAFGGMVLLVTFYPERLIDVNNQLIAPTFFFVGIPVLIGLTFLVFYPKWGTAFLALMVMFLVAFSAYFIMDVLGLLEKQPLSSVISLIGLIEVITLVVLAYLMPRRDADEFIAKIEGVEKENNPIPYDTLAVIFTGLIIVGLGLGLMVLVNSPYLEQLQSLLGL